MIDSLSGAIEYLSTLSPWLAIPLLGLSAMLEYVFPPFPGDSVTVAGAVLAQAGEWDYWWVFLALTAGSVLGSWLAFLFGRRGLTEERINRWTKAGDEKKAGFHRVLDGYKRFGPAFLVVNRFLPGIRAFFFVGAGIANMRTAPVLFYSSISAAAWNLMLMVLGWYIGSNLHYLEYVLSTYTTVMWGLLGLAALVFVVVYFRRRRARKPTDAH